MERFYDPLEGTVMFNGKDLKEVDTKWYHQTKLAIVQQEPNLFSTTIRENVLYGFDRAGLSDEQVELRVKEAL